MNQISDIRPISDAEAGRLVSPETLADLAERITAIPRTRDRRHVRTGRRRRWRAGIAWLRTGRRPLPFLAACVIVTGAAAATASVIGLAQLEHAKPRQLFIANPAHMFPHTPNQTVIPQTVRQATTFTVAGAGRFEFWIALSHKGWLCEAIRQPDGTWADLGNPGDRYQIGGPVPGCEGVPWQDGRGYSYYPTTIATKRGAWHIVYGYAPAIGHPAKVRDRLTGATAPIGDGRFFAIVIPLCRHAGCLKRVVFPRGFQLETLNAAGRVLTRNTYDPGN